MIAIRAKGLKKRFKNSDTDAIKKLDLSIKSGKVTGLIGPDGAGKTTLIRILTGLLSPTEGELEVLGYQMPQNSSDFLQNIGYMPQKFGLYEDLSVDENLHLYADLQGVENAENRINELLDFTSLKRFRDRRAGKLSGGMKQKLGLACSLIKKPKLLLLDEPGVGVDPISRKELWAMVQELLKDNITVLWATSYLDEADMCEHIIMLSNGDVLYQGAPEPVKSDLKNRVYLLTGTFTDKREALTRVLENGEILDAVLVGSKIRMTLKKEVELPHQHLLELGDATAIEAAEPNFEDAFVDILNSKTKAHSDLAAQMTDTPAYEGNLIEAKGLTKRFGDFTATDNVDFAIGRGEIFGFLGPNGAGKSTVFKMLCGLLVPTKGVAHVMDENLYTSGARVRNSIGYMAQKFSLYGNMNIKDNLAFFAGIYGLTGNSKKTKIDRMIETFDFKPHLNITAETLPLGLKQRLALACSVIHEPRVLFLDEPTSGVDPITRKEFWTHINGMVKKGVSIMVTTHFMDEAEYCDRIMLIYRGKAIATGTPDELKQQAGKDNSMEEAFITLIQKYDKEPS